MEPVSLSIGAEKTGRSNRCPLDLNIVALVSWRSLRAATLNFLAPGHMVLWKTIFPWTGTVLVGWDGFWMIQGHYIYCAL